MANSLSPLPQRRGTIRSLLLMPQRSAGFSRRVFQPTAARTKSPTPAKACAPFHPTHEILRPSHPHLHPRRRAGGFPKTPHPIGSSGRGEIEIHPRSRQSRHYCQHLGVIEETCDFPPGRNGIHLVELEMAPPNATPFTLGVTRIAHGLQ